MRIKTKKIPLYFGDLVIIQTDDLKDIENKFKLNFNTYGFEALTFLKFTRSGYCKYYMAFKTDNCNSRKIAHEALHAVGYIYKDRGIEMDINNDEPQCYLLGWIVGECHKFLNIDDSEL